MPSSGCNNCKFAATTPSMFQTRSAVSLTSLSDCCRVVLWQTVGLPTTDQREEPTAGIGSAPDPGCDPYGQFRHNLFINNDLCNKNIAKLFSCAPKGCEGSGFAMVRKLTVVNFSKFPPDTQKVDSCQLFAPFSSAIIIGPTENSPMAALADKARR